MRPSQRASWGSYSASLFPAVAVKAVRAQQDYPPSFARVRLGVVSQSSLSRRLTWTCEVGVR